MDSFHHAVFTGIYENDKRVSGKMIYANGEIYEGEFKGDIRHGQGKMTSVTGDVYEGYFETGLKNGMGILTLKNGNVYEVTQEKSYISSIYDDKSMIVIALTSQFCFFFQGSFKDGHYEGLGLVKFTNGDMFKGEFKGGKRNGFGQYRYKERHIFEGMYKDDKCEGHGKQLYSDGETFDGHYKNNVRHGQGKYMYINGDVFEGKNIECKNVFSYFCSFYETKSIYRNRPNDRVGNYENDVKSGLGKYTYANGTVYEGEFLNGDFEGTGKCLYADGDKYIGKGF